MDLQWPKPGASLSSVQQQQPLDMRHCGRKRCKRFSTFQSQLYHVGDFSAFQCWGLLCVFRRPSLLLGGREESFFISHPMPLQRPGSFCTLPSYGWGLPCIGAACCSWEQFVMMLLPLKELCRMWGKLVSHHNSSYLVPKQDLE